MAAIRSLSKAVCDGNGLWADAKAFNFQGKDEEKDGLDRLKTCPTLCSRLR